MEAKDSRKTWITDEREFFALIEARLRQQGYEVLETMTALRRKETDQHQASAPVKHLV